MTAARHAHRRNTRFESWSHRLEYRLLVALTFAVCFVMISGQRAFGAFRGGSDSSLAGSIFTEARSAAHATAGYVFNV